MKQRNPKNRFDLNIKRNQKVIEIGGGHNPHPRANVVVDKYVGNDNFHRASDLKVYPNQQFIEADGENLPFPDKSFDYAVCNHVLEHVDHPDRFLNEQCRVAKRGYMETPSLLGEYVIPKISHKWVILEIDDKLILYDKKKIDFATPMDFGYVFLNFLPTHSIGYKILQRTQPNFLTINYEWSENIDYIINPSDSYYLDFFTKPWEKDICRKIMVQNSLRAEARNAFLAFADICQAAFKSKIIKRTYVDQ